MVDHSPDFATINGPSLAAAVLSEIDAADTAMRDRSGYDMPTSTRCCDPVPALLAYETNRLIGAAASIHERGVPLTLKCL